MTQRASVSILLLPALVAFATAFLSSQTGLAHDPNFSPWLPQIHFSLIFLALWLPAVYLFFNLLWGYLSRRLGQDSRFHKFLRFEIYSYAALPLFLVGMLFWQDFGRPDIYFRGWILFIFLCKSLILLRTLYTFPQVIRPAFLVVLSCGFYALALPFHHISPLTPLPDFLQRAMVMHLGILALKAVCLSLLSLEMFRLSVEMTKSVRSAFFSWLVVSFTFPALGFPGIFYILAGMLLAFVLRMFLSRVDTKELITGLLQPSSITIAIKLAVVAGMLFAATMIFWSNVRPGFDLQETRAIDAFIGNFFNGQFGVFCYAPIYLLAVFGIVYFLFFRTWNGILLIATMAALYGGYHLIFYAMLGHNIGQPDIVPFLPFCGIFIAVAHQRFGKIYLFRILVRLLIFITLGTTSMLLLLVPDFSTLSAKFAEIQWALMHASGKYLNAVAPSLRFRSFTPPFLLRLIAIISIALLFCFIRTRLGYPLNQKIETYLEGRFPLQQLTFYPFLTGLFLLLGAGIFAFGHPLHPVQLKSSAQVCRQHPQQTVPFAQEPISDKAVSGALIVSHLEHGAGIPHNIPVANLTVYGTAKSFATFTLKAGRDTAETLIDTYSETRDAAHGRAEMYRTYALTQPDGRTLEAHDYYTSVHFSKPLSVQKISAQWLLPPRLNERNREAALSIIQIIFLE